MPTSPSTLQMVLDAPTWTDIRSQRQLCRRRQWLDLWSRILRICSVVAPCVVGTLAGLAVWRFLVNLGEFGPAVATMLISASTVFAVLIAGVVFFCVDFFCDRLHERRLALSPLGADQAVELLGWCSQSQDVDAYRLHVVVEEGRELCLGDYAAVVQYREAQEGHQQALEREVLASRALRALGDRAPVWAPAPVRRLTTT